MTDPTIDPKTGEPIQKEPEAPTVEDPNFTVIPKTELASMQGKLDAFDNI